jgi:predicted regulator of Ras-like GTPase activity (Roadblock/LC7/MglB family)
MRSIPALEGRSINEPSINVVAIELRRLRRNVGVTGALLATADGHPILCDLADHDAGAAAAVVASSVALAERLGELTGVSQLEELLVRTTLGYAVLHAVDGRRVLAVLTDLSVNLARLKLDLRDAIDVLAKQAE